MDFLNSFSDVRARLSKAVPDFDLTVGDSKSAIVRKLAVATKLYEHSAEPNDLLLLELIKETAEAIHKAFEMHMHNPKDCFVSIAMPGDVPDTRSLGREPTYFTTS